MSVWAPEGFAPATMTRFEQRLVVDAKTRNISRLLHCGEDELIHFVDRLLADISDKEKQLAAMSGDAKVD